MRLAPLVAVLALVGCSGESERFAPPPSAAPLAGDVPHGYRRGALVYDPVHNRSVFMGGDHVDGDELLVYLDTHVFEDGAWRLLEDAGLPDRSEHSATFDVARGRVVLFGGYGTCFDGRRDCCDETWELVGDTWELAGVGGPPARVGASLVYDPASERALLFGGTICRDPDDRRVWAYDGETWEVVE